MVLRVAIADDSYIIRAGLSDVLGRSPEIDLVAVCEDTDALLQAIERELPDVVLSDVRMPPFHDREGIALATQLRHTHPKIGVVILSQYADPTLALELFEAGTAGRAYLLKERVAARNELVDAIKAVAAGHSVVDPKIVEALIAERSHSSTSPLNQLTLREREVLTRLAAGQSNAAIAASLSLSKHAVEKHINSIFLKLNLRYSKSTSHRVMATLIFLADQSTGADSSSI